MPDKVAQQRIDELAKAIRLSERCLRAIAATLYDIGLDKSGKQAEEFALALTFIRLEVPRGRTEHQARGLEFTGDT
jgi:hypothetical protein